MKRFTYLSIFALAVASTLPAQTLLNEDFSDNERGTQSLTTSSAWYLRSGTTTTLSAGSGALVFTQNATPILANIVTYFTDSGSRTIADGETISASFTLSVSNTSNTAGSFRFGFFDSQASRVSVDDLTTANAANAAFTNYKGYQVGFSTGTSQTNYSINERTGTSMSIFGTAAHTQLNATNNVAINATAATPFNVSFSVARSGTNYSFTSIINGQTATTTDTSITSSAFDTFALQYSNTGVNGNGTVTLDNLNIAVSAIPEPSTYASLVGLGVLGLAASRRRR